MAKNSQKTQFLNRRNGRMDGRTDRPSYRDAFLTDASKNGRRRNFDKKKKVIFMIFTHPHYLSRVKGYSQLLLCEAHKCHGRPRKSRNFTILSKRRPTSRLAYNKFLNGMTPFFSPKSAMWLRWWVLLPKMRPGVRNRTNS